MTLGPPPQHAAYLLDLDGTLIDIAPTPGQVVVPDTLPATLRALRQICGNALAVVTGRPIAQVDTLLGDAPYAVAGEHGAAVRHAPGTPISMLPLPVVPAEWMRAAHALVAPHAGAVFEPKAHGFVLHYRGAPSCAAAFHDALAALLAKSDAGANFVVLAAKMAWEIRPLGVDKGSAVRALMAQRPFAGRVPIFVGDDVTDEDGITAAEALGGVGLRVGTDFADAAAVRTWLAGLAGGGFTGVP
jgi:trehalose 6-phosphate phosphatase